MEAALAFVNRYDLATLARVTVADRNGDIARIVCGMVFLPAVVETTPPSRYWEKLEQPWTSNGQWNWGDIVKSKQILNAERGIKFLDLLEQYGKDPAAWAPMAAQMIGACLLVEGCYDSAGKGGTTVAAKTLMENVERRDWWAKYAHHRDQGSDLMNKRCRAAESGKGMPAWDEIFTEVETAASRKDTSPQPSKRRGKRERLVSWISDRSRRASESSTGASARGKVHSRSEYERLSPSRESVDIGAPNPNDVDDASLARETALSILKCAPMSPESDTFDSYGSTLAPTFNVSQPENESGQNDHTERILDLVAL